MKIENQSPRLGYRGRSPTEIETEIATQATQVVRTRFVPDADRMADAR
ncbi:hypothetical protein RISK_002769 [Rhodopirellula islandica]|uniref:Uncharacterized protein n=1 Tax=Rhodopirellula islandica TaxID=595434 RepID=A0A0J1BF24_RHOIS|nr:hypothetical protein RISK_002769 [Rhodopirellula islandica]